MAVEKILMFRHFAGDGVTRLITEEKSFSCDMFLAMQTRLNLYDR